MTDYNDLWELDRGDYVSIITELRAELAEARADVQRFEAALDVSQRELAEARGQSGKWKRAARIYREELRNAMRDEFAGEFNHLSGPELWEATRLEADQWTGRWSRQRRREHQAGKE